MSLQQGGNARSTRRCQLLQTSTAELHPRTDETMGDWNGDWMNPPTQSLAAAKRVKQRGQSETKEASSERAESTLEVESLLADARTAATHDPQYQLLLKGDEKHDGLQRRDGLLYTLAAVRCTCRTIGG